VAERASKEYLSETSGKFLARFVTLPVASSIRDPALPFSAYPGPNRPPPVPRQRRFPAP
jgi:hypothetical protein